MKVILVSLYYEKNRVTGANKRFDKVAKYLNDLLDVNVTLVVNEGQNPFWNNGSICNVIEIKKPYNSKVIQSILLEKALFQYKGNIIINDFMPIPLLANYRNNFFQLIHDVRNFTEFNRSTSRFLGALFQKVSWSLPRKIITVSHFTKNEILKNVRRQEEDIIVSYNGFDQIDNNHKIRRKDIDLLYIATYEKRKNHENLVKAIELCNARGMNLKVTFIGRDLGLLGKIKNIVTELHVDIIFLESVTELELQAIYYRTKCFISPSCYEGFGMPLIEAYSFGCKILCSDISVFKEIGGDYFKYFDPFAPQSICETICKNFYEDEDEKEINNPDFLHRYKWEIIIKKLVQDITN